LAIPEPSNSESISDLVLAQRLRAAIALCSNDELLLRRGSWLAVRCLIGIGSESLLLVIDRGKLSLSDRLPPLASWDFAIRGTAQAWAKFWQHPPPPGWHDLLALSKRGEMRLGGHLQPLMTHLQYFKDLLALPRGGGES
jgi:hypothetical protein